MNALQSRILQKEPNFFHIEIDGKLVSSARTLKQALELEVFYRMKELHSLNEINAPKTKRTINILPKQNLLHKVLGFFKKRGKND